MSAGVKGATIYPAQMTPKQIVHGYSSNGWINQMGMPYTGAINGMPQVSLSPLTANVLRQVMSLTGPGVLEYLAITSMVSTGHTLRCQIILDGVTVLDSTSASLGNTGTACYVGMMTNKGASGVLPVYDPIFFKSSCVVNMASNLSESNAFTAQYVWRPV